MSSVAMHRLKGYFDRFSADPESPSKPSNIDGLWEWPPLSESPFTKAKSTGGQALPGAPATTSPKGATKADETPHWVPLFYDLAWTAALSSAASLVGNPEIQNFLGIVSYVVYFILLWWLWASQAVYAVHFYTNDLFHSVSLVVQLCVLGMLASTIRGCDVTNYILHSPGADILKPEPRRISDITDSKTYKAERMAASSLKTIAILVVISRIVHLVQYIRVLAYARATPRAADRVLLKMCMVSFFLVVSIALFASATMLSASVGGKTPLGAKLRLAFGCAALLAEAISIVIMPLFDLPRPPTKDNSSGQPSTGSTQTHSSAAQAPGPSSGTDVKETLIPPQASEVNVAPGRTQEPQESRGAQRSPEGGSSVSADDQSKPAAYGSNITLSERLEGVTTIILGEGINAITGSLYTVLSTPWSEKLVRINVISTAAIICSIVYLYFESTTRPWRPEGFHEPVWLFLHLPFLLGITLLLIGMQKQLLLSGYLYITLTSLEFMPLMEKEGVTPINPSSGNNSLLEYYFLRRGFIWKEEWQTLINKTGPIVGGQLNQSQALEVIAWKWRLALKTCVEGYEVFLGENRKVPDAVQSMMELYVTNQTVPVADDRALSAHSPKDMMMYYKIIDALAGVDIMGVRYIIGLAGGVFISLGLLSLARFSKPQDRFHWGIILSRFGMGWSLCALVYLNFGRYQTPWIYPEQEKYQAGVFRWMIACWVLPTIALAFVIEIIVELVLTWLAMLRLHEKRQREGANKVDQGPQMSGVAPDETSASPAKYLRLRELAWREVKGSVEHMWDWIVSKKPWGN